MKLHYKKFGTGQPFLILHGLLGMSDNWQTFAKIISEYGSSQLTTGFEVFNINQRNHGHSPHSPVHNYQVMADDLYEFLEENRLEKIILLGHSMGGKTAMKFAQQNPERVEKLIVVDIAPKAYPVYHTKILEGLAAINLDRISSRGEAEKILLDYVANFNERQFLLKNLYWIEKGKLSWRFNFEAIQQNIESVGEEIMDRIFDQPTLFVKGGNSDYIKPSDYESIEMIFPKANIVTIPNAGHWVHAEQPELFFNTILDFVKE